MRRSLPRRADGAIWEAIMAALEREGVLSRLTRRVAMQLVVKCERGVRGERETWRAVWAQLVQETAHLRARLGLVDRQIIVVLPKLAPAAVEALLDSLTRGEPSVAPTMLNASLDPSVPRGRGRALSRGVPACRVIAVASEARSGAHHGECDVHGQAADQKAKHHLQHFDHLVTEFGKTEAPIRTLAREACRAAGPRAAGHKFIKDRQVVMERLTRRGTDVTVARTIASIACVAADPMAKGNELFAHFDAILQLTKAVHPHAARSIAFSAWRSPDPMTAARRYMDNDDRIVEMVSRIDRRHAPVVAAQAFR